MMIAIRIRENGEVYLLERGQSDGFEFGNPALGKAKHHSDNVVIKMTVEEAIAAIRDGYHPRMKGQISGQWNMIAPANVQIFEVPK